MSYKKRGIVDGIEYDPMKEPRYAELATFMRAPLADSLEGVDIGLIGVPTDLGVTNRPGARHGPREIRNSSSLMRAFNVGMRMNPYDHCRIADLGDVRFSSRYDLKSQVDDIARFYRGVHEAGVLPVTAEGITPSPIRFSKGSRPSGRSA
jgi:guanidinopropionase